MKKLTPVLIVEEVEPCLEFWENRLGFVRGPTVPHGDKLGFALAFNGPVEIMFQSRASVAEDLPALGEERFHTAVYIEVESLAAAREKLGDTPLMLEPRETFYGSREIGIRDPGGTAIILSERVVATS
jgi:uncharacterized glyoxalase superfamily protein PhnB